MPHPSRGNKGQQGRRGSLKDEGWEQLERTVLVQNQKHELGFVGVCWMNKLEHSKTERASPQGRQFSIYGSTEAQAPPCWSLSLVTRKGTDPEKGCLGQACGVVDFVQGRFYEPR